MTRVALLASSNPHKLEELRHVLPGWRIDLLRAEGFPEETGETYYENALTKARFGRRVGDPSAWALGEDSGIEVEALGGGPGVRSARWADEPLSALLSRLEGVEPRKARYVCELVCLSPGGGEFRGRGVLEGRIAGAPRGGEGFGYDPVFVPASQERTVAELGNDWKRSNSHRACAAGALREALRQAGHR